MSVCVCVCVCAGSSMLTSMTSKQTMSRIRDPLSIMKTPLLTLVCGGGGGRVGGA